MGASDGEIRINTKVDESGFNSGVSNMKNKIKSFAESVADLHAIFAKAEDNIPDLAKRAAQNLIPDAGKTKEELNRDADAWNEWAERTAEARGASRNSATASEMLAREREAAQASVAQVNREAQAVASLDERVQALRATEKQSMLLSPEQADAALSKVQASIQKVNRELDAARSAGSQKEMRSHLDAAQRAYADVMSQQQALAGKKVSTPELTEASQVLSDINKKIATLQKKINISVDPNEIKKAEAEMDALVRKGNTAAAAVEQMRNDSLFARPIDFQTGNLEREMQSLEEKYRNNAALANSAAHSANNYSAATRNAGSASAQASSQIAQTERHTNSLSKALDKSKTASHRAAKAFATISDGAKHLTVSLKHGLKTFIKYAFGVRSIYFLFRRIRRMITEGFKSLAQQFPEFNEAMSMITNSFNRLKGSLSTAIAPFVTAFAPQIRQVINWLSDAISKVAEFFAALTGQATYYKAIETQEDYAASLNGTADAAQKAAGQLMGFDKLNVINTNSGSGSGSSSGADKYKFEEAAVSEEMQAIAARIRKAFQRIKPVIDAIKDAFLQLKGSLGTFFDDFIKAAEPVAEQVLEILAPIFTAFVGGVQKIFDKLHKSGVLDKLSKAIQKALRNAQPFFDAVEEIIDLVFDVVSDVLPIIIGFVSDILPSVGTLLGSIGKSIKSVLPLIETILKLAVKLVELVLPLIAGAINGILGVVSKITDLFSEIFDFSGFANLGKQTQILTEEEQKFIDKINEEKLAWDNAKRASSDHALAIDVQADKERDLWKELQHITDENGNIKQGYEDRAAVITGALSEALGIEIQIVDGQIQKWGELGTEIDKVIAKKQADAYLTAYQEEYTLAVKNAADAEATYVDAKTKQAEAQEEVNRLAEIYNSQLDEFWRLQNKADFSSITEDERKRLNELRTLLGEINPDLNKLSEATKGTYIEAKKRLDEFTKAAETAGETYGGYSRTIENYARVQKAAVSGSAEEINDAMLKLRNDMVTAETDIEGSLKRQTEQFLNSVEEWRKKADEGGGAMADSLADKFAVMADASIKELMKVDPALARELNNLLRTSEKNRKALEEAGRGVARSYGDAFDNEMATKMRDAGLKTKDIVQRIFNGITSDAKTWGKDFCDNFAKGMNENKAVINNASIGVANQISRNLAYSEPKEGVLSKTHTWMPDMIKLLVSGINSNAYRVENAVASMAAQMRDGFTSGYASLSNVPFVRPAMSTGTVLPYMTSAPNANALNQASGNQVYNGGNAAQNTEELALLRELIRVVKGKNLTIAPSASLGKVVNASTRLYQGVTG